MFLKSLQLEILSLTFEMELFLSPKNWLSKIWEKSCNENIQRKNSHSQFPGFKVRQGPGPWWLLAPSCTVLPPGHRDEMFVSLLYKCPLAYSMNLPFNPLMPLDVFPLYTPALKSLLPFVFQWDWAQITQRSLL